jgi:hypothetical protein
MTWLRDTLMKLMRPRLVKASKRRNLNEVRRPLEAGADVDGLTVTAERHSCRLVLRSRHKVGKLPL